MLNFKATHYMSPTEARIEVTTNDGKPLAFYDAKTDKMTFPPGAPELMLRELYKEHIDALQMVLQKARS